MNVRESQYNYMMQDASGMVIYNSISDRIVVLLPELAEIYNEKKQALLELKELHPQFYDYLAQNGFIVRDDGDEFKEFLRQKEDSQKKTYSLIINPTLNCNMRCWYCYENHGLKSKMDDSVKEAVFGLLEKIGRNECIEQLYVSFFGGEPLLFFDKIVMPIIKKASVICNEQKKKLEIHFTTNAFLLTEDKLNQLKIFEPSFQITFDGNKNAHNAVRQTVDGRPSYQVIMNHIRKAVSMGLHVGVRFNYTHRNYPTFEDVLQEFSQWPKAYKEKIIFTFQRVWQDDKGNNPDVHRKIVEMENQFETKGLRFESIDQGYISTCYADKANSAVVNYNGELYKCTARDFTSENSEGVLRSDGELIWNEKYEKRKSVLYGNAICQKCRAYPICHGGCSQMKLENPVQNSCPKGHTAADVEEMLKKRATFLLKKVLRRKEENG